MSNYRAVYLEERKKFLEGDAIDFTFIIKWG